MSAMENPPEEPPQEEKLKLVVPNQILNDPNPFVQEYLSMWARGGCSWEQAVMQMVISLSNENQNLKEVIFANQLVIKYPVPKGYG